MYVPLLLAFMAFWQVGELLAAQLIVQRAASAPGRAAAAVLPDDPAFYTGGPVDAFQGLRQRDIELAAGQVLAISPRLTSSFSVDVEAARGGFAPLRG